MARHTLPALLLLAAGCATAPGAGIEAEELEDHVRWLAADAREGRGAATEHELATARYCAEALAGVGLEPAGPDGSWLQSFSVPLPPRPGEARLTVDGEEFADVGTIAASATEEVRGPLVSAGYGVVLESHGMDDFRDADVEGAVVLVRRYTEFGPDAEPQLARLGSIRAKMRGAIEAGAVGMILGTHPSDVARGGEPVLDFGAVPGGLDLPVITVTPEQFARLEEWTAQDRTVEAVLRAEVVEQEGTSRNVLGLLPGTGDEIVVIGAHMDHLGWGGAGSLAPGVRAIHNGADDNASGTAMVLELAEHFAARPRGERGLLFALWGAEEMGLLGSSHFVAEPTVPLERIVANVNLDMVGRLGQGRVTVGSAQTAEAFAGAVEAAEAALAAAGSGLELQVAGGALPGGGGSDHMSFHKVGIPALFFFSGLHSDYHRPSDDPDKVTYGAMADLGVALAALVADLQGAPQAEFAYVAPEAPADAEEREVRGARVWFGSIPDYGADPEGGGMQLAGTSPGGPAEAAGLRAGDVIKRIGDFPIGDIYDFMDALAEHETGETVTVEYLRDGRTRTVALTFFARPAGDA